jgi:integrase
MSNVKVIDVLSFLQEYVDEKRAASTIRAAYSALLHYFVLFQREDIINSPIIKLFYQGSQRTAPPVVRKTLVWDPEIPLKFIAKRPRPESLRTAGREAMLLLLLATGIRVSDAARLSKRYSQADNVYAFPYLEHRKTGISEPQLVKEYPVERLCPVRAIKHFLDISRPRRLCNQPFLFISSTGSRASVDTLRKWVITLLSEAGVTATAGSCRSAATSAAVLRDLPIDAVMKAAGWKREHTFRKFYHRLVHKEIDCESLLPQLE